MTLEEYRGEVERLERHAYDGTPEALAAMAGLLARDLENALWRPGLREEARALAGRARKVQRHHEGVPQRREGQW